MHLGVTTVSKLMSLFQSMSSPTFLFADEYNFQLVAYLLETFNNILIRGPQENPNFVYSVLLHHADFEKLDQMTFSEALEQVEKVRKVRAAKEEVIPDDASVATEDPAEHKSETVVKDGSVAKDTSETAVENTLETAAENTLETAAENTSETVAEERSETVAEDTSVADAAKETPAEVDTKVQDITEGSKQAEKRTEGFEPTEAWMAFWKEKLPLHRILNLIQQLLPQVEAKCKDTNVTLDELMQFLKTQSDMTDEGQVFIRQFQWGEALVIWFRSMMWGQNYVSSMKDYGPWNGTHVKLFQIKQE